MQSFQVIEHVNAPTSVQMRRLKQPQVMAIKVTQGARQSHVIPLLEIEGLELGALVVWIFFARRFVDSGKPRLITKQSFFFFLAGILIFVVIVILSSILTVSSKFTVVARPVSIYPCVAFTACARIIVCILLVRLLLTLLLVVDLALLCHLPFSLLLLFLEFDKLLLQFMDDFFVIFQHLKVLHERLHRSVVGALLLEVRHLNVESDRQEIEDVLLVEVTKLLHRVQQIELLGD